MGMNTWLYVRPRRLTVDVGRLCLAFLERWLAQDRDLQKDLPSCQHFSSQVEDDLVPDGDEKPACIGLPLARLRNVGFL